MRDNNRFSGGEVPGADSTPSLDNFTGPFAQADERMRAEIQERFLSDHLQLRGKCGVVANLALNVLRGDEDLALALRLKGEELYRHLLDHMTWEEKTLIPLLREATRGTFDEAALLAEHASQRKQLDASLVELRRMNTSNIDLAKACIALVRWLDTDMAAEERAVLRIMADAS